MGIFIQRNGIKDGPFNGDQIKALVAEGKLSFDDLAFVPGNADWLPLKNFPALVSAVFPSLDGNPPQFAFNRNNDLRSDVLKWFVGPRGESYLRKWSKLEGDRKVSWNWAAWFGGPAWMFHRKMYRNGIIILAFWPLFMIVEYAASLPAIWGYWIMALINMGTGLYGNYLYKEHSEREVCKILTNEHDAAKAKARIISIGGTSVRGLLVLLMCFIAWQSIAWAIANRQTQQVAASMTTTSEQQIPQYDGEMTIAAFRQLENKWATQVGFPNWELVNQNRFDEFITKAKSDSSRLRALATDIRSINTVSVDPEVTNIILLFAEYIDTCAHYVNQQSSTVEGFKLYNANYTTMGAYAESAARALTGDLYGKAKEMQAAKRKNEVMLEQVNTLRLQIGEAHTSIVQQQARVKAYIQQQYGMQ
jgi:hypothetical protein